jgi:hypothetical protein
MRMALLSVVVLAVAQTNTKRTSADGRPSGPDVSGRIVASWQARQGATKTLRCSVTVVSFYPKGCLSERLRRDPTGYQTKEPVPEADKKYVDEPCSWALDFAAQRVRKESHLTEPFFYQKGDPQLAPSMGLRLFTNGKFRFFRPRESLPDKNRKYGVDVDLYEENSQGFLLSFCDLPVLWLAGGVSGRSPIPTELQYLEKSERFTYRGDVQRQGVPCVILTVQEQLSKTAVREFWVGAEEPYPIYVCRARDIGKVYWQIDCAYRKQDQRLVPTAWTYTEYDQSGKVYSATTYTVQQIQINNTLAPALFEKRLESGMVAFHVGKNDTFDVDGDGNLVPLGSMRSRFGLITVASVVALLLAFGYTIHYVRKRKHTSV